MKQEIFYLFRWRQKNPNHCFGYSFTSPRRSKWNIDCKTQKKIMFGWIIAWMDGGKKAVITNFFHKKFRELILSSLFSVIIIINFLQISVRFFQIILNFFRNLLVCYILFCFKKYVTGEELHWNHTEFSCRNILFCCNTVTRSNRFDFTAVLQGHFFMLQPVKFFFKRRGAACTFFIAFSTQNTDMQLLGKCC